MTNLPLPGESPRPDGRLIPGQPSYSGPPQFPGQPQYPGQSPYPGQPQYPVQSPYPGQPQYPGQPSQSQASWSPAPPSSALQFTVQGNAFTSSFVPPTLTIDGYPAPVNSGTTTTIPIQPGQHRLEAFSQWLRRYGQASLDVTVPPNTAISVFYAPPWHQFTTGEMGLTPQKRKGVAFLLVPLVVVLLIVVITFVAVLLGS